MLRKLYKLFIAPRQQDEDLRNRELVLNVLLAGSLLLSVVFFIVLVGNYAISHDTYLDGRIGLAWLVMLFWAFLFWLSRRGHARPTAFMLVGLHFLLATAIVWEWGIAVPSGQLLFSLDIVLAGILLGPKYSLYVAGGISMLLIGLQLGTQGHILHPDWSWLTAPPTLGDALSFSAVYGILALVSWLFNNQMENSLHRMQRAELALTKQRNLLESTVEKRTRQLQAVQLEKIQQLYHFAELGQLSTALLHELANHLTTLTLDIEGLGEEHRSGLLNRAKRSIRYMDDMVVRVRNQLRGKSRMRLFSVAAEIEEVVTILSHKARESHVRLRWESSPDVRGLRCRGEPTRFRQLMANIISNAVDAYHPFVPAQEQTAPREVVITLTGGKRGRIVVTVNDWGKGVSSEDQEKLFEPLFSTKKTGMGMGLFVAQQIAKTDFQGNITIDDTKKHTAFVITLASS